MYNISFGSDNHSGMHAKVMDALAQANTGYCPAYGDDPLTLKVLQDIETLFGGDCEAWFVITGTGANILCLQSLMHSFHAVICAATSHINVDECGAVQKFTQARLNPIETPDGKLTPALIAPRLLGDRDQHHSQFKIISISQSTEYGTLYTLAELSDLADFAHKHNMLLHIDGARLANAAVALNCTLKEMTKDIGADIVSFGGTKNGMLFGEAIISFRPELTADMRFYRKQASQLFSKMRFIAAQFEAYLAGDLWKTNALQANNMAALLAKRLGELPAITITQEVFVNALFAILPEPLIAPLQEKYLFYTWDEARYEVRLMCSFNTQEEHIDDFIATVKQLLKA
ncbi:MAG: threonine aldolase [Candidatus Cloacimonetes bacterium HGW-Cloacimonetes-3]|jgi:threonine aldolase|nr:MAG: threonine aldolase [Candidatus Cloacimonetes bacterium HGW-Cloacimonetes-3]